MDWHNITFKDFVSVAIFIIAILFAVVFIHNIFN